VFVEEFVVVDSDSVLWDAVRPLLLAALRLEQNDEGYVWHGWKKYAITEFLQGLPDHCTLMAGVWGTLSGAGDEEEGEVAEEREVLVLGSVCEVLKGEICSICTFEALADSSADLPPLAELDPGFEHAAKLMSIVKAQIAPVAWALFTDKPTWDAWIFGDTSNGNSDVALDKGEALAQLARQGRCVLMGNQAAHHQLHFSHAQQDLS